MQKNQTRPLSYNTQNLKQTGHLNERPETKKPTRRNHRWYAPFAIGLGNAFFDTKSKDY